MSQEALTDNPNACLWTIAGVVGGVLVLDMLMRKSSQTVQETYYEQRKPQYGLPLEIVDRIQITYAELRAKFVKSAEELLRSSAVDSVPQQDKDAALAAG